MITLIGVKHTEKKEEQLKKIIYKIKPEIVCVELDEFRYKLYNNQLSKNEIREYYEKMPRVFNLLLLYKKRSEREVNVDRDWDIKLIFEISKDLRYIIKPIDKDQKMVYTKIQKQIMFSEKIRIQLDILRQNFKDKKKKNEDLKEVFSTKYPTLKKILIDERNKHIAEEIKKISLKNQSVVVILGNAHLQGISSLIKDLKPELIVFDSLKKHGIGGRNI